MPKSGASLTSTRSRRFAPRDRYESGSPPRGMYLSPSSGFAGTHGFARTDQSSCHRLNNTDGRGTVQSDASSSAFAYDPAFRTSVIATMYGEHRNSGGTLRLRNLPIIGANPAPLREPPWP